MSQQPGTPVTDNPAAAAAALETVKPTEKEALLFLHILGSMTNKPEVDWELVANKAGYSTAQSARTRYAQIKKRLGFTEDGGLGGANTGGASGTSTPFKTPKKTPASAAKKDTVDAAGNPVIAATPTKVRKPRPSRSKKAKAEAEAAAAGAAMLKNENQFVGGLPQGVGGIVAQEPGGRAQGFDGAATSPFPKSIDYNIPEYVDYGPYGLQNPMVTRPPGAMGVQAYHMGGIQGAGNMGDAPGYQLGDHHQYDMARPGPQIHGDESGLEKNEESYRAVFPRDG